MNCDTISFAIRKERKIKWNVTQECNAIITGNGN